MSRLHVLFSVGDVEYVVAADQVQQMESYTGATLVPGAPDHVAGLVQLRGRVVPVVDLRRRFGLDDIERTLDSRVVVVRQAERTVGLLADRAREVLALDDDAFHPPPDLLVEESGGFIDAVARAGDRLLLRLDLTRVIGKEDLHGE